jgi:DNA-directed RNA polymerase subunit RPC12/RpoP
MFSRPSLSCIPYYTWTYSSEVDAIVECSECNKKTGLESRFVKDGMVMSCPYCGQKIALRTNTKEEPSKTEGKEIDASIQEG